MTATRRCPQCQSSFVFSDGDQAFLDRVAPMIAGKIIPLPPPTLCPDCRLQRRLAHRNERNLYRRKDDATGSMIIAGYPAETPFPVYNPTYWWGDRWDPLLFGMEVDLRRSFLKQFQSLRMAVPRMAFQQERNENSEYTNNVSNLKDCYLLFSADFNRNCSYGTWIEHCNDCIENTQLVRSEQAYECLFCHNVYAMIMAILCSQCHSSAFLFDCRGCSDCFLCWNLREKRHYIRNVQYSEKEYRRLRADIDLSSFNVYAQMHREFLEHLSRDAVHPPVWKRGTVLDSTGDMLSDAAQCRDCFQVVDAKDCARVFGAFQIRDIHDACYINGELAYEECECFPTPMHSAFNLNTYSGSNLYYCDLCMNNCQDCFGCIGLRHARHCILNKQYSEEEYATLLPKIIDRMMRDGEFGEFLPASLSLVSYNESQAGDHFPLTEEEVKNRGWQWWSRTEEIPAVRRTIAAAELSDALDAVPDDILNWAIRCEFTGRPFKIIRQELAFYRQMRLPIPRLHPDERHRRRTALGNPRHLWSRKCAKCQKAIETSYSPERPERVYCESCYLAKVY
ncbi:MAG: zinc-ribbon domain containing protein [Candidatus Peregrinibacteria bacterium]